MIEEDEWDVIETLKDMRNIPFKQYKMRMGYRGSANRSKVYNVKGLESFGKIRGVEDFIEESEDYDSEENT